MFALFHEGTVEADKKFVLFSEVKYIIKGMKVKKLKKTHKSGLRLVDASTRKRPQILYYAS